jgi:hypothetical protein
MMETIAGRTESVLNILHVADEDCTPYAVYIGYI